MTENRISDALEKGLQQQGYVDDKLRDHLTPCYSNPPQLYGLPKIHKDGVPMCPIVSAAHLDYVRFVYYRVYPAVSAHSSAFLWQ